MISDGNYTYGITPLSVIRDELLKFSMASSATEDGKKRFVRIPVKSGSAKSGYTVVQLEKDVPRNTRFVTKGAYYLQAEMKKTVGGHQH